jgi:LysM repeat protein
MASCSKSRTTYNPEMGPFDEDGNYIEAWADNPPKPGLVLSSRDPKPAPRIASTPKPVYKPTPAPAARPKPKPVVVKPKRIRHSVRKGDTLWGLARKYGTTVTKIKKANGLRSDVIRVGKTYLIPK